MSTLRMLLIHSGIKHDWSELRMVMDVARWLEQNAHVEVNAALEEIRGSQSRARATAGILLAVRLMGVDTRNKELSHLLRDDRVRAHAALAAGRLFGPSVRLPGYRPWAAYSRRLDGDRGKALGIYRYVFALLTPEFPDWVAVEHLPRLLWPASVPLRGWRLASKLVSP